MRARRVFFTCLGLLAPACGAPYGGEPTAPGSTDGGDAGPATGDASAEAATEDAAVDAGHSCGWVEIEDHFDGPGIRPVWSRSTSGTGASVAVGIAPVPRGTSLAAELLPNDSGGARFDYLSHALRPAVASQTPSCVSLSFALFVENASGPSVGVAAVYSANGTAMSIWLAKDELQLIVQSVDGSEFFSLRSQVISFGAWHDVILGRGVDGSVTMAVDGEVETVAQSPLSLSAPSLVAIGANYVLPDVSGRYWIDDVSIR